MLRRLSVLALALASIAAAAPRVLADFAGRWEVLVQGPQGPLNSVLDLTQSGDSVKGNFASEVGTAAVAGTAKGDSVTFQFQMDAGGQMLSLTLLGALKDKDHIAGKIVAEGMGEFPFEGQRKAAQ